MRYLTLAEIVNIHQWITDATGGASGIRDLAALESAIAQPKATFDMNDLYPTLVEKAAALCFSIVQGHPFLDGNKRAAHAAIAVFLEKIRCSSSRTQIRR
jgi:death-on-curing protein